MSSASNLKPELLTAEALLALPDPPKRCELIRGELIPMSPAGGNHGNITHRLNRMIDRFLERSGLGPDGKELFAAETGFILVRNPDTVRAPDIAYITTERLPEARTPKFIPIPPDLAVEVNSPNDRASDVTEKVTWWLTHGVRLVWVVDPQSQTVTAYHPDGTARVHHADQPLDGGDVLPGFTAKLKDIFGD